MKHVSLKMVQSRLTVWLLLYLLLISNFGFGCTSTTTRTGRFIWFGCLVILVTTTSVVLSNWLSCSVSIDRDLRQRSDTIPEKTFCWLSLGWNPWHRALKHVFWAQWLWRGKSGKIRNNNLIEIQHFALW